MVTQPRIYTVLVPIANLYEAPELIRMAVALMPLLGGAVQGRVVALGVVELPGDLAFSAGTVPARLHRQLLGRLRRLDRSPTIELRTTVRVAREVWHGIVEAAADEQADLILLGWKGQPGSREAVFTPTIDQAVRSAPCDIAVVSRLNPSAVKRILVPVRGGPHAELALRLAVGLANATGSGVTALRIETPDRSADELDQEGEEFHAVLASAGRPELRREVVVRSGSIIDAIVQEAQNHQVVVMGAAARPEEGCLFGPIADRVARRLDRTALIVVKTRLPANLLHQDGAPLLAHLPPGEPGAGLSTIVDKWFAENTFDSHEFDDLRELVRLKERQGLTISLGLPTLNEEETIGTILKQVTTELVQRYPLLDEVVVVDSRSTDRTRQIAEQLGVPVVVHQEVLPETGSYAGKGEALWKSLHVLRGDLVAWVDTDIKNFHPRFVYGIVGPLLKDGRVKYVKGFYKRPIRLGRNLVATGGGRVTELTARPLLNLFYPELSGMLQPLAGEYAARREVLEGLPFFTGYGVEVGLLIDLLERYGLQAIGQVDLKRRVHRNQSLYVLSAMAFTVTSVILQRLEQSGRLRLDREPNRGMKLIQHERDRFHIEIKSVWDHERPPILTIPAYQARRAAGNGDVPGPADSVARGRLQSERGSGRRAGCSADRRAPGGRAQVGDT